MWYHWIIWCHMWYHLFGRTGATIDLNQYSGWTGATDWPGPVQSWFPDWSGCILYCVHSEYRLPWSHWRRLIVISHKNSQFCDIICDFTGGRLAPASLPPPCHSAGRRRGWKFNCSQVRQCRNSSNVVLVITGSYRLSTASGGGKCLLLVCIQQGLDCQFSESELWLPPRWHHPLARSCAG